MADLDLDLFVETEEARYGRQGAPLDEQREEGDDVDDVEERLSALDLTHHRVGGEDDRHGATQTHPREEAAPAHADAWEEDEAELYRQWSCHEDHEETRQHGKARDGQQALSIDEEPEDDEERDL